MSELLSSGLDLMLLGMGTVFVFLAVLVFSTLLMSKILMKIGQPVIEKKPITFSAVAHNEQEIVAVAAAVSALVQARKASH
mgnify:CR=1 FL=1|jgi:oxaloacetate decarboxylase gamma subunit